MPFAVHQQMATPRKFITLHSLLTCLVVLHFRLTPAMIEPAVHKPQTRTKVGKSCPPGYYGDACEHTCPPGCDGTCDEIGRCKSCSRPGVQLPECHRKCPVGEYGRNCAETCSEMCWNKECDVISGECLRCSKPGFSLPSCSRGCLPGTFGPDCKSLCPLVCREMCDPVNGTCKGCSHGTGPLCSINCASQADREACRLYCPGRCLTWCSTSTGRCSVCVPGYQPPFCNRTCDRGYYGNACSQPCSELCQNKTCEPVSGVCYGCRDGYVGRKCNGRCIQGYHGQECDLPCSEMCLDKSCDFITGACHSCRPGYTGMYCDQLCQAGMYGHNCSMDCPDSCLNTCDPVSGQCPNCAPGFFGTVCNETCQDGFFGSNCSEMCSVNCVNFLCDAVSGICLDCKLGYRGPFCEQLVSNFKRYSQLELAGFILLGCVSIIILLGVTMYYFKRKDQPKLSKRSIESSSDDALSEEGDDSIPKLLMQLKNQQKNSALKSKSDCNIFMNKSSRKPGSSPSSENLAKTTSRLSSQSREGNSKLARYILKHGRTYTPADAPFSRDERQELKTPLSPQFKARHVTQKQSPLLTTKKFSDPILFSTNRLVSNSQSKQRFTDTRVLPHPLPKPASPTESTLPHQHHRRSLSNYETLSTTYGGKFLPNDQGACSDTEMSLYNSRRKVSNSPLYNSYVIDRVSQIALHSNPTASEDKKVILSERMSCSQSKATICTTMSMMAHPSDPKNMMPDQMQMVLTQSIRSNITKEARSTDSLYGVSSKEVFLENSASYGINDGAMQQIRTSLTGSVKSHGTPLPADSGLNRTPAATSHTKPDLRRMISSTARASSFYNNAELKGVVSESFTAHSKPSSNDKDLGFEVWQANVHSEVGSRMSQPSLKSVNNLRMQSIGETELNIARPTPTHVESATVGGAALPQGSGPESANILADCHSGVLKPSPERHVDTPVGSKGQSYKDDSSLSGETSSTDVSFISGNVALKVPGSRHADSYGEDVKQSKSTTQSYLTERAKQYRKMSPPKYKNLNSLKHLVSGERIDWSAQDDGHTSSKNYLASKDSSTLQESKTDHNLHPAAKLEASHAPHTTWARPSASLTLKGDVVSPRLIRCSTTRQVSPMYNLKGLSQLNARLKPLPTPPPEGRKTLRPIKKTSSISMSSAVSGPDPNDPED
ncbi:uncharacterized protein LOC131946564 [Physella acuta]|uniref:uncharacterized protein LOC131946564 n=1 Tax=Physella acuta TaxID=109671 RepID=UPI0027DD07BB|nr:uncharacterized protein LOC131946564 [Physella acuta]XP_059163401.1 uncharacterized protein LOC131946564 [Physella acuta]